MKFDLDVFYGCIIAGLLLLIVLQYKDIKNLQTQIDELTLIVSQKFLPAMILDKDVFRIR
jgi:hypothetical protein